MKKMFLKRIITFATIISVMLSLNIISFAATDPSVDMLKNANDEIAALIESEGGTVIPGLSGYGILSLNGDIAGPFTGDITSGQRQSGTFTIPSDNTELRVAWILRPQGSASTSAVFSLTVGDQTLLLGVSPLSTGHIFTNRYSSGQYTYTLKDYANVSGSYIYAFQFYSL